MDAQKPDKLIAKIQRVEAHLVSFQVSNDYKYLILRDNRMLYIANIESMDEKIKFKPIFEMFRSETYVSILCSMENFISFWLKLKV